MSLSSERVRTVALNEKELFEQLVSQVGLTDLQSQDTNFSDGKIKKVIVHKQQRKWEFYLEFPSILMYETYARFEQALQLAFKDIATCSITITVTNQEFSTQLLQNYWPVVVKNDACQSPLVQEALKIRLPIVDNSVVIVKLSSDAVVPYLKENCFPSIVDSYESFGFPKLVLKTEIDEDAAEEAKNAFESLQQQQEELFQEQATRAMEQHEEQKAINESHVDIAFGRSILSETDIIPMGDIIEQEKRVIMEGYVFSKEIRQLKNEKFIMTLKMTDYTSSFTVKKFSNNKNEEAVFDAIQKGMWLRVRGSIDDDSFLHDMVMNVQDLVEIKPRVRKDLSGDDKKRVELHLHTNMSMMDALDSVGNYVEQAAKWGHPAIAVTDHASGQSFPDAYAAGKKHGVKILYGLEANIVDDGVQIAYNPEHLSLSDSTYVVFDVETTGLSAVYDTIIELAAVKMHKGNIVETFEQFIDPGHPLSQTTINLTGITDDMVRGSKSEEEVLQLFKQFSEDTILVAHNASFDIGFLNTSYERHGIPIAENPVIDTLEMSRFLHPQLKSHRLNTLAKRYKVNLEQHHRAIYDSESTGHLCWIFIKEAADEHQMFYHDELNSHIGEGEAYKNARPFHATILATTQAGLKNLFKLISMANVNYFYRVPRIPRSELEKYREGLLVGSACSEGELFEAMMQKGTEEAEKRAKFYDYIEIMPKPVYAPLLEKELVKNEKDLEEIIRNLVSIAHKLDKIVVATGDVHYCNPEEHIYRDILIQSITGMSTLKNITLPKVHFRTTDDMLKEFAFLGKEIAKEVVITNPNKIADLCEEITPVKTDLYTPKIEGSEDEIRNLSYTEAYRLYGDPLPDIVEKRLEKELKSIIGNGFSVIYLISQKLVHKSLEDGYLVGSRGSVGSSLVATMTGITEVNPLPPHYRCPKCHHSEFFDDGSCGSGFDLPDAICPECGERLAKDGHDIPFETFLGFHGDKVPDIDLNFSGDYQAEAHNYTKVLFGEDYVYRAGTIGTIADKTAYGYVKGYERDNMLQYRGAEIDRLAQGITGVKRTTGQHPGGIIVIPDYMDVYDFTPIQYPADDQNSEWRTTHFDFHSIHDNVLKLDILGHDDPTVIRMLQELSGIDPKTIPPDDPDVMKLFSGTEVLGVTEEQIYSKMGTLGIPEFGTSFVRGMLEQTHPTTFAELLQISGLSHGTDVWLGNAEDLIRRGVANLSEVIGCRDDIMVYLIHHGMDDGLAFKIMESVRKGKGIPDDWQEEMRKSEIPEWYIESCLKIKYMFPKAHAAAYILMALRVAYFKVHYPMYYYAAYFSVRANDFDLVAMSRGKEAVKSRMKEITIKGNEATTKEKNLLTVLELANEMWERGFEIRMVDLYKSDANDFIIEGDALIAPFRAVPSLGDSVAKQIVLAREEQEFLSKEDLSTRGKVSKTILDYLDENGVLKGMPEENQLSLFDMFDL